MSRRLLAFFALFGSLGTLVCCALPALLVALGLGASLASFLSSWPQLIWFSEHKGLVFGTGAALIAASWLSRRAAAAEACPADPALPAACRSTKRAGGVILCAAIAIYATGAFFAFAAPLLFTE